MKTGSELIVAFGQGHVLGIRLGGRTGIQDVRGRTYDYFRRGPGFIAKSQEVRGMASSRVDRGVIGIDGLGQVQIPIFGMLFMQQPFEISLDGTVNALTGAVTLGMVRGGPGFLNTPNTAKVLEGGGLEICSLVRVHLEGRAKTKEPGILECLDGGLGSHIGKWEGNTILGKEVEHNKDYLVTSGGGGKGTLATYIIKGYNLVPVIGQEGSERLLGHSGTSFKALTDRAGVYEKAGVEVETGPVVEMGKFLFQALVA